MQSKLPCPLIISALKSLFGPGEQSFRRTHINSLGYSCYDCFPCFVNLLEGRFSILYSLLCRSLCSLSEAPSSPIIRSFPCFLRLRKKILRRSHINSLGYSCCDCFPCFVNLLEGRFSILYSLLCRSLCALSEAPGSPIIRSFPCLFCRRKKSLCRSHVDSLSYSSCDCFPRLVNLLEGRLRHHLIWGHKA